MVTKVWRALLVVSLLAAMWAGGARTAYSAQALTDRDADSVAAVYFMLTVSSAYARSVPRADAEPVFSAFEGQVFPFRTSTPDGVWLEVTADGKTGWLPASYGEILHAGGPPEATAPLAVLSGPAARSPTASSVLPSIPAGVVPVVSDRARQVYAAGLRLGNNPRAFAKVGDCNSENGRFLVMFDESGHYDLGGFSYLEATIRHFAGSFGRTSIAAHSGFSPETVMDPVWANPAICEPGEGPLQCEYRLVRPSFAIIALGTHNAPTMDQYEADMRAVIEATIERGVVPILATKADDVEGGDRVNPIIRHLAAEYEMPLWDFWAIAQRLPGDGLTSDGIHLSYSRNIFDDPFAMTRGWPWRNLTALLALEAVLFGVSGPQAFPELPLS